MAMGKRVERSFAHTYDTGGMRRTHLRGGTNILKRVLIHTSGFNLGLVMRRLIGVGTPRGLQGRLAVPITIIVSGAWVIARGLLARGGVTLAGGRLLATRSQGASWSLGRLTIGTCTTGC